MQTEFQPHNLFKKDINSYLDNDPHLSNLKEAKYVFHSSLKDQIPLHIPGIYILTGGRQVGKSTLIKLMVKDLLLQKKASALQIFYVPCDLLQRYQELVFIMERIFEEIDKEKYFYLFLDEITYVKEWDRAIKYFADLGYITRGSILITGSDSLILKESMKKIPGRRGKAEKNDFHYYPLSFSEFTILTLPELANEVKKIKKLSAIVDEPSSEAFSSLEKNIASDTIQMIGESFQRYLLSGGFLPAINEYGRNKKIGKYVYRTYQQWVIGDLLKRNKKEHFLKEIITILGERLGKQLTMHGIASATEIQHHSTIQEYLAILEDMDVIFIQQALREDKLKPAPKKAKKIHFADPFIMQALLSWVRDIDNPLELIESPYKGDIVEGCVSSLFKRKYKIYYIKSEGEVDMAILSGKGFLPVEIKWREDLPRNELKQILKYKNGIIGYKGIQFGRYEQLYVLPIPILALFV